MKIIILSLLLLAGSARADEQAGRESYASTLLGAAVSTTPGAPSSNVFVFSGRLGTELVAAPSGAFAMGLFVGHDSITQNVGNVSATGNDTFITTELLGRRLFGSGLYFGPRVGFDLGNVTISVPPSKSYSANATVFTVGPALGYEFPIIPQIAFDVDTCWMWSPGTTFDFPGLTSIKTTSSSGFAFQGGITFHW